MATAFLLKEDGGYLLQEDGVSKIILEYDIDAALTGLGSLSAILSIQQALEADLSGAGDITAALEVTKELAAIFQGLGSLSAQLTREAVLQGVLTGTGALTALLTVFRLEQEGFRGYEDDADEGANTPLADQDVNFDKVARERFLGRFLVNNLGDAQTVTLTVEGRLKGSGDPWAKLKYLNPFSSGFDEGSGHG